MISAVLLFLDARLNGLMAVSRSIGDEGVLSATGGLLVILVVHFTWWLCNGCRCTGSIRLCVMQW